MTRYACHDRRRLAAVAAHPDLNGIDWLEVLDTAAPAGSPRQRTLLVRLVKPAPAGWTAEMVTIAGGEHVAVVWAATVAAAPVIPAEAAFLAALPDRDHVLVVRTDRYGDHGPYTLTLRRNAADDRPPPGFDPRLATIAFSFKVECPAEDDCLRTCVDDILPGTAPPIDLLARDYDGFRRLMLARMRALLPGWTGSNPADLGVTLVELLAYAGDQLAYWQDAVSAEAYIGTARLRPSLRRHALLVDYRPDEGANARAFVQLEPAADMPPAEMSLAGLSLVAGDDAVTFEAVAATAMLDPLHHRIAFHTWSDAACSLPKGATAATLVGRLPNLRVGDVLILEEALGPLTGKPEHTDPARRHAVRLTTVTIDDSAGDPLVDPLEDVAVTEVAWTAADALPFALCLSTTIEGAMVADIGVARGNMVLADAGMTVTEALTVPPGRFRPTLAHGPLVHRRPLPDAATPAAAMLASNGASDPQIVLTEGDIRWSAAPDLLLAAGDDERFVVETEHDGTARLRFGDDRHGRRPAAGSRLAARYRIGGGAAGNVGADSIRTTIGADPRIVGVRNPLPATGGTAPESATRIRQRAATLFLRQERAVTVADWEELLQRRPAVARAATTSRWTGSWHTGFVAVDMVGGAPASPAERRALATDIDRYRLAGRDAVLDDPVAVALALDLTICVAPGAVRADVAAGVRRALGSGIAADGRPALFHPDRLTFGQAIHLSPIYAAARGVSGVASVEATRFGRRDAPSDPAPLAAGVLRLGRGEIARLGSDPDRPDHGTVRLTLRGGR